jgi:hypothetical protein
MVHEEENSMSKKTKVEKEADKPRDGKKKKIIQIALPVIPSDEGTLDDEMSEMFEEDSVKHKHGSAEPERD